jgi:hypothetical protein
MGRSVYADFTPSWAAILLKGFAQALDRVAALSKSVCFIRCEVRGRDYAVAIVHLQLAYWSVSYWSASPR